MVARVPLNPLVLLRIDTLKSLSFTVFRRAVSGVKKQKSSYAVFPVSFTIGYELHPPTNPWFPSWFAWWIPRWFACSKPWRGGSEPWVASS